MGCGYTKRECAIKAIGEIAGYLDPDDTLISDALELMIRAHKENPTVSLVHSRFYYCNELLERTSLYDRSKKVEVSDRFINLNSSVNHFASFKKILYDRTLGIDASVKRAVDQDLYLKLSEIGSFYFIDKPLYNYRVHLNGISISNTDQAFFWFLKVIMKTEQRRKINLEKEAAELLNRSNPYNMQINLVNPRYLILTILNAFKKNPIRFFKKLFLNRY
jgi:hypothetical protein